MILACSLAVLLLTGCSSDMAGGLLKYGDGLLSPPKLPGQYLELQKKLDEVLATGAVYAVADTGSNRQAVQLIDLDGDGSDEAIAFFRKPTGEFEVYVYRRTGEGYEELGRANGYGKTIRAVHYLRHNTSGQMALALSFVQEDNTTYGMTIFVLTDQGLESMLDTQYVNLVIGDVDSDTVDEVCLAVRDSAQGAYAVRTYAVRNGAYKMTTETPLCIDVKTVSKMTIGYGVNFSRALYVDSVSSMGGYVTDVITLDRDMAYNETIDHASGSGAVTWRAATVFSADMNGDGVLDVPVADPALLNSDLTLLDLRYKLSWTNFTGGEAIHTVATTFHNVPEEWYLDWPDKWDEKVLPERLVVNGVPTTIFYVNTADTIGPPSATVNESEQLLAIYVFSGENSAEYAKANGVTVLKASGSTIYGYKLPKTKYSEYALTEDEVARLFHVIRKEWLSEGYSQ